MNYDAVAKWVDGLAVHRLDAPALGEGVRRKKLLTWGDSKNSIQRCFRTAKGYLIKVVTLFATLRAVPRAGTGNANPGD